MYKYILKRLVLLIPVMLGVTLLVFAIMYLTPGDPAQLILGESAPKEAVAALREKMGLNDPFFMHSHYDRGYVHFLGNPACAARLLRSIPRADEDWNC